MDDVVEAITRMYTDTKEEPTYVSEIRAEISVLRRKQVCVEAGVRDDSRTGNRPVTQQLPPGHDL